MAVEARLPVDKATAEEVRRVQLDMQAEVGERMSLARVLQVLVKYWRTCGASDGSKTDA